MANILIKRNATQGAVPSSLTDGELAVATYEGRLFTNRNRLGDIIEIGEITPDVCCGRLTLSSTVPVTSGDQASKNTLYYLPYNGNVISIYNGRSWDFWTIPNLGLSITFPSIATANCYDVFVTAGSPLTLSLSAWTSLTSRGIGLNSVGGVYSAIGNGTRYLGTIIVLPGQVTHDTAQFRYVWNYNNRVRRPIAYTPGGATSWTYTGTTYRQANATATNGVFLVNGGMNPESLLDLECSCLMGNASASVIAQVNIGISSTTVGSGTLVNWTGPLAGQNLVARAKLVANPVVGFTQYNWLEKLEAAGTATFFSGSATTWVSGLAGTWES